MTAPDRERLLTVTEAAARGRVSRSCIYQLVAAGLLAHCRIGPKQGRIRIASSDLDAYLDASHRPQRNEFPTQERKADRSHVGAQEFRHLRPPKDPDSSRHAAVD